MSARINKYRIFALLKESLQEFSADNGTLLAASISFNFLFSLFPLVFMLVYIAGHIPQWPDLQNQILRAIGYLLPMSRELLTSIVNNVVTAEGTIGALALIGLVWGGISVFDSVRVSLNAACGIRRPHPIFKAQLFNIIMLLSAGFLLFVSVMISILLKTIHETDLQVLGVEFLRNSPATHVLANILVTGLALGVFLLLYKLIPSPRPKWKDIWKAALAAAIFFEITKIVFLWYVGIFSPYNLVYGSMGTLIAFLMWIYLSALIFLFIAKISHVNIRMRTKSNEVY